MPSRRAPRGTTQRLAVLLAGVLAVGVGTATYLTDALSRAEQGTVNARFALRDAPPPKGIVVVAIDDVTFSDLGLPWPFPRSRHAAAIDRLHAAGAREIVYDIQFTEPTARREDLALYRAIERAGGAVLATTETDDEGRTNVLGGDANLARIDATAAASNFSDEAGRLITRMPHALAGLRTVAVVTAERVTGESVQPARFSHGGALIDYRGGPGTFPTVSFSDLVRGRLDPAIFRGKVVVVGASAPTLQDVHATPTSGSRLMSGPEVQANAIWTVLHGLPLRRVGMLVDLLAILVLGMAAPLAALRLRVVRSALAALAVGVAFAVGAQLAFDAGAVVAVAYPLLALAVGVVGMVVASHVAESRERSRVSHENELLEGMVRERTQELRDTQLEIIRRLGQAAESRDEHTGRHIERISRLTRRLGLATGMSAEEAELLGYASAMHDIGKIGIPDRILLKPGSLDPEEWEVMKSHTTIGAAMLADSRSPLLRRAEVIARTHHERWDGSGYPLGLAGEEIPLEGRICAICDVFDALVTERHYKGAWSLEATLAAIRSQRGLHFDPRLVDLFLALAPELDEELADVPFQGPQIGAVRTLTASALVDS